MERKLPCKNSISEMPNTVPYATSKALPRSSMSSTPSKAAMPAANKMQSSQKSPSSNLNWSILLPKISNGPKKHTIKGAISESMITGRIFSFVVKPL